MKTKMYQNSSKCGKGKIFFTLALVAALMFAGCGEADDNPALAFKGKWTSAGRMGTIELGNTELGKDVAKAINESAMPLDLTDLVKLDFSGENVTITTTYQGQAYSKKWRFVYRDALGVLSMSNDGQEDAYNVSFTTGGDEFFITPRTNNNMNHLITAAVIQALCEHELRKRGYQSMEAAGLTVTGLKLTIRFIKVK